MTSKIVGSLPALSPGGAKALQADLGVILPADYKQFLMAHIGGFIESGPNTFRIAIPFTNDDIERDHITDVIDEFFGVRDDSLTSINDSAPHSRVELNNEYREEHFLPRKVIVVGRCGTDSLLCLSTRLNDLGHMYYWYYYWKYPWAEPHFQTKIEEVLHRYPNYKNTASNPNTEEYVVLADELNYATLTFVASSFIEFMGNLMPEPELEDDEERWACAYNPSCPILNSCSA